ncbi:MAG: hypothetical protein AAFZ87_05830 [Planctomycetota bacterium]
MTHDGSREAGQPAPWRARTWTAVLVALTLPRAQTLFLLPELRMFGGEAPDAWLAPWASDAVLGVLVPVAVFAVLRKRGPRWWAALLIYCAVGAFDYSHGLLAQFTDPLPSSVAPSWLVYAGITFGMTSQLASLALLLLRAGREHFIGRASEAPD